MTSELSLQWLPCQAPGVIGSALGLVSLVSVYCDFSVVFTLCYLSLFLSAVFFSFLFFVLCSSFDSFICFGGNVFTSWRITDGLYKTREFVTSVNPSSFLPAVQVVQAIEIKNLSCRFHCWIRPVGLPVL